CIFILFVKCVLYFYFFFFSSRRRHTRSKRDWSSDVCSSDLSFPLLSASFFLAAFISLSSFRTDGFFGTDGAYSLEVPSAVLSGLTEIGSDRRDFSVFANEGFCCFPSFFTGSPNSSSMSRSSCDFSGRSCCGTAGDSPDIAFCSCDGSSFCFGFPVSGPACAESVSRLFPWDFSSLLFSI